MHNSPAEEEKAGTRSRKWDAIEKDKFKRLVKKGILKWDGNPAHREEIRKAHWPDRKKETFRRNWNTSAAEFRVAEFKDGARARSADKGEYNSVVCVHIVSMADTCLKLSDYIERRHRY